MEEFPEPDPLLKPGAFIDPSPISTNGNPNPNPNPTPTTPPSVGLESGPTQIPEPTTNEPSDSQAQAQSTTNIWARPEWLPPDWTYVERVRSSGASAGSRDKYYVEPVTQRRFRSKTAVLHYLETGIFEKKRKDSETGDNSPATNGSAAKRKKSETKVKDHMKNFDFDDVPLKVKWELMDLYEGTWRPLTNGVDRVPESTKQEWNAAFTYITLQNAGRG